MDCIPPRVKVCSHVVQLKISKRVVTNRVSDACKSKVTYFITIGIGTSIACK